MEVSTCDIVAGAPRSDSAPEELCPLCSPLVTPLIMCSAHFRFTYHNAIFRKVIIKFPVTMTCIYESVAFN